MDTSLYLYKGKLKEALTLVPTMSREKKVEAVVYWNDLAEQLQEIVHKGDSSYDPEMTQNLHVRVDDNHGSLYTNSIERQSTTSIDPIHCDPIVTTNLPSSTDSTLITPAIKQTPINQFHQENLIDKAIFENSYLVGSPIPAIDDCKDHLPSLLVDKISPDVISTLQTNVPSTYVITQPDLICSTGFTTMNSTSCSSTRNNSNIRSGDLYTVIKHSNMLTQVPNQQISANKSIVSLAGCLASEVYPLNVEEAQVVSNTPILNYLTNDCANLSPTNVNKLDTTNLNSNAEYDNALIANSRDCPKTTTNIIDEIGNGQFDRGPKLFDEIDRFANFESNSQTITLNPSVGPTTFISTRNELFTQSERPLQQIQLFNSNTTDYPTHSYTLMNNRIKYLFCNTCNEHLESHEDLERHEQLHSPEKGVSTSTEEDTEIDSLHLVEIKTEVVSSSESDKIVNGSNQHTCEVCGKSGFSTKGNLKRHLRAHSGEKPFRCDYCDSCFTEKKSLKIHVRRHTGEKPYKCEICGKLFSQTGVLQSHMALHLNERKFDCQKCGKAFRQRSQLKLHLMRHDGVKRLECSTCMAKFLTKGDLERHCRIHTGERPYSCKICNKTFTRQQSLNEHMNRHTGRKPYDCKYCEKTFSEMSACYKHAKTHRRQDQTQHEPLSIQQPLS